MTGLLQQVVGEQDLKVPLERVELLAAVKRVLNLALAKSVKRYTKNAQRIKWTRLAIQAVTAGNRVLRDYELEELTVRIQALEEADPR